MAIETSSISTNSNRSSSSYALLLLGDNDEKHKNNWLSSTLFSSSGGSTANRIQSALSKKLSSPASASTTTDQVDQEKLLSTAIINLPNVVHPPSAPDADFSQFTFTIRPKSTVILVYAPAVIRNCVTETLHNCWGIDNTKSILGENQSDPNVYQLRLKYRPFMDGAQIKYIAKITGAVCCCIEKINRYGYELTASIDLTNQYPASTLFFAKKKSSDDQTQTAVQLDRLPCLIISDGDRLTLIDASDTMSKIFLETINKSYYSVAGPGSTHSRSVAKRSFSCPVSISGAAAASGYSNPTCDDDLIRRIDLNKPNAQIRTKTLVRDAQCCPNPNLGSRASDDYDKSINGQQQLISIRLKGQPFRSEQRSDTIRSRKLILDLIRNFDQQIGYETYGTLNLCSAGDSLLFKKSIQPISNNKQFMMISLHLTNKMRFFDAPPSMIEVIRSRILPDNWPQGYERLKREDQRTIKLKFKGHPWNPNGDEFQYGRKFLCRLFACLFREFDWRLVISMDFSRRSYDKAVFIFRKDCDHHDQIPEIKVRTSTTKNDANVFCLNLSAGSRCQLFEAPDAISDTFDTILRNYWPRQILRQQYRKESYRQWTLQCSPWSWTKLLDAHARSVIDIFVHECRKKFSYRILTGANILAKYELPNDEYPRDGHCIFFCKIDR